MWKNSKKYKKKLPNKLITHKYIIDFCLFDEEKNLSMDNFDPSQHKISRMDGKF